MTNKAACVFALDVACTSKTGIDHGCTICLLYALDTMLYTPHDKMGLVLTGTNDTFNPLFENSVAGGYRHIIVEQDILPPTMEIVSSLRKTQGDLMYGTIPSQQACNIIETIAVCASLLSSYSSHKARNLTIYFITDAKDEVVEKAEVHTVLEMLQKEAISLVVVGINFQEKNTYKENEWDKLGVKAQNELVLRFLCDSLGGRSRVISEVDALKGLYRIHRNTIPQRPLLKVVLTIGNIHIATQMFTKSREVKLPALNRVTASGEAVYVSLEYRRSCENGAEASVVSPERCTKAFRYGKNLIPITPIDWEATKNFGMRSIEALAFVPQDHIPAYVLMGGVKVVLALTGDHLGQRAFSAFVQAMIETRNAMIVRLVRTRDAHPVLAICLASCKGKQDALFLAQLPFADDVSLYMFPQHHEVRCSTDEEQLVADLVQEMTVDKNILTPSDLLNPFLLEYREYLIESFKAQASNSKQDFLGDDAPVPLPKLRVTSTPFSARGNVLEPMLRRVKERLELCAKLFPCSDKLSCVHSSNAMRICGQGPKATLKDHRNSVLSDCQKTATAEPHIHFCPKKLIQRTKENHSL